MRIVGTTVRVREPESAAVALAELLGLAADRDARGPIVRIGWTRVHLVEHGGDGIDHLAILIPGDAYTAAKAWLLERTTPPLLGGEADIAGPPGWHSTSVYFDGPDAVVLELIAHDGHRTAGDTAFSAAGLLGICEVGVAVPDMLTAVAALRVVGVQPFAQVPDAAFTAVGDLDGRLILVRPGRTWFPTRDRIAGLAPLEIEAQTGCRGSVTLGGAALSTS